MGSSTVSDAVGLVARRAHSPPFQGGVAAPLIKRSRSLAAQTGWLVISNKIWRLRALFANHPGRCAATPPWKGGEWVRFNVCNRFRNVFPRFESVLLSSVSESDHYPVRLK